MPDKLNARKTEFIDVYFCTFDIFRFISLSSPTPTKRAYQNLTAKIVGFLLNDCTSCISASLVLSKITPAKHR